MRPIIAAILLCCLSSTATARRYRYRRAEIEDTTQVEGDSVQPASKRLMRRLETAKPHGNSTKSGRAPSCNGCARRESVLAKNLRLDTYKQLIGSWYARLSLFALLLGVASLLRKFASKELVITLFYSMLYLVASPTAILVNKILMKDYGFGYPGGSARGFAGFVPVS